MLIIAMMRVGGLADCGCFSFERAKQDQSNDWMSTDGGPLLQCWREARVGDEGFIFIPS